MADDLGTDKLVSPASAMGRDCARSPPARSSSPHPVHYSVIGRGGSRDKGAGGQGPRDRGPEQDSEELEA